jgi:serine/threonine-protein kinase ULK2
MPEEIIEVIPHRLEGYEFITEIGQGSFSTVYLANQHSTQIPVAIKVIKLRRLNRKLLDNLQSEISVMRNISNHENIGILKIIEIS